jgi:hypothetical protein
MAGTHTVRGDSWTIVLPDGWKAPETLENGTVYIDSVDESKGIFVTAWMLAPEDAPTSPADAAESFKSKDVQALQQMDGYVWRLVGEGVDVPDTGVAVVFADHLADANEYRIATKVIARPPLVVRAAFHDYNCDDYEASRGYFAPLIESLTLANADPPRSDTPKRAGQVERGPTGRLS